MANGTLVVAAAGNSGINNDLNPHFPSNYKHVLAVGATGKTSDQKASFSNYGTTVDVFAPGTNILSTTPNNNYSSSFSGTSMASPLAAGLAALVKTQNPAWSVDQQREQVRVSCNNIDGDNPTLIGLLGMGRINALRTVTDFASSSIRVVDLAFSDNGNDGIFNAGETIDVAINFTNYLSSISNVAVQLNTNDDKITFIAANAWFLTFNSDDTLQAIFQFTVASDVPDGHILRFYLDISNANYQDRDFFTLVVNPPKFVEHNTGIIRTAITTQGNIGWIDFKGESGGIGFVFAGADILFEGGLMLGTSASSVSDCIRGSDQSTQDNNFRPGEGEFITVISPGQFSHEEGSILLVDSLAPNPLGVTILQKSYADTTNGINNFVIFNYEISNTSGNYISNLHVGLFFDWDIDPQSNDWARYDAGRKMGYVLNSASNPSIIAATGLLTSTANTSFRAIHNPNELYDGFTDEEKWRFLSTGIQSQNLDNVDVSTLLSEGPFDLPAGEKIEVGFAVIAAKNLSKLTIHADKAQDFWNNPPSTIDLTSSVLPNKYGLDQNFPNPFNPSTKIKYHVPKNGRVNLEIFNLLGQKIKTLVDGEVNSGIYEKIWDGKDQQGNFVASGIYIYQLKVKGREAGIFTKKMLLLK